MTWIPVSEVRNRIDIGETTIRRYAKDYKEFIKSKKVGNALVINEESFDLILKIKQYSVEKKWNRERIKEELQANHAQTIVIGTDETQKDITVGQTLEEIHQLTTVIKLLVDENRQLKEQVKDLHDKMDHLAIQQTEQTKLLSTQNKSWSWLSWFPRRDRTDPKK